jgi:hypothetical protein
MNDAAVVAGLMRSETFFFFKNRKLQAWMTLHDGKGGCESNYTAADNGEVK